MSFAGPGAEQRLWDRDGEVAGMQTAVRLPLGELQRNHQERLDAQSLQALLAPGSAPFLSLPPSVGFEATQISQEDLLLRPLTCLHPQRHFSTSAAFQPSAPTGYVLFRLGLTCLASP